MSLIILAPPYELVQYEDVLHYLSTSCTPAASQNSDEDI